MFTQFPDMPSFPDFFGGFTIISVVITIVSIAIFVIVIIFMLKFFFSRSKADNVSFMKSGEPNPYAAKSNSQVNVEKTLPNRPEKQSSKICQYCGEKIDINQKFCSTCGEKVN